MPSEIIGATFITLARYFGGIEISGMILLGIVGFFAFMNRATMPTVFFCLYILSGALNNAFGGLFFPLFGLMNVAGAVFIFLGAKQQFGF